jgi:hypothetical protein
MRRLVTMISVTVLVLAATGTTAGAQTTRADISGTQQVVAVDDSQARTWTAGPIEHLRGLRVTAVQQDTTYGLSNLVAEVNTRIDTRTGSGSGWGTFRSDFGGGGFEGTFRGTIHVDGELGPIGTWQVVGHGWGDLARQQVRGTVIEQIATGAATYTGTLLVPGGG